MKMVLILPTKGVFTRKSHQLLMRSYTSTGTTGTSISNNILIRNQNHLIKSQRILKSMETKVITSNIKRYNIRSYHITSSNSTNTTDTTNTTNTSNINNVTEDIDLKLRQDVKMLGQILGDIIKEQDPLAFQSIETLRKLARLWRNTESIIEANTIFETMKQEVSSYDSMRLKVIARSFTQFLALSNVAESHHRIRRLRNRTLKSNSDLALPMKKDSCAGVIIQLKEKNISNEKIFEALSSQYVEIVLTAHPTEVNRRTILRKLSSIHDCLVESDRNDLIPYERRSINNNLQAYISSIWQSDELRRMKPGPIKEAKSGLAIVENVLWNAIPSYLRKLDDVMQQQLGKSLPLDVAPLRISSWMGGDRDGNPNVTPEITYEVSLLSRWVAASLYKTDIAILRSELSQSKVFASHELLEYTNQAHEPYRYVIKMIDSKLQATIDYVNAKLKNQIYSPKSNEIQDQPILYVNELMEPMQLLHRSLVETNNHTTANGFLIDVIRKIASFGLTLLPLDIRQESSRHSEALDAITRYLGIGSYLHWDELTRRNWLQAELSSKRPLLQTLQIEDGGKSLGFSDSVVDTLKTFQILKVLGTHEGFNAYVISQCQQTSDILAVALLQQDAGVNPPLRVVPLFETLDDLERSDDTIEALFSIPAYRGRINNQQEIMVGYSDSAKDAGRLAASWAQYNAQVNMSNVAKRHQIKLTFFHGKGGTVGRGGNPAVFEAILAHPPETIQGRFRVTEQGEMITQNFGQLAMAERSFDLMTAGVLMEQFLERPQLKESWKVMMQQLSDTSCKVYRQVVREDPRFVPYFRCATPELELAWLNVGSRPSKRNPKGGVESLRAIPWVFAWTQTRLNLPTWLGVGEALSKGYETHPKVLQDMYQHWPWFTTIIDLVEMILVKSEEKISENYDQLLVNDIESLELGKELRKRLNDTSKAILLISGNQRLQAHNVVLLRSLAVRNPYVDPLNIIQAELLKRFRSMESSNRMMSLEDKIIADILLDGLMITINGIANGMRNSG